MLALALALTRSWTAFYTRGLPPDLRSQRREEIDSDLWEQRRQAGSQGETLHDTTSRSWVSRSPNQERRVGCQNYIRIWMG